MRSRKVLTGYGNGSVYEEKRGSGRWIAELDGVRRRAKSEAEALEKLALLQQRREERLRPESITLDKWLDKWLTEHCEHLRERSRFYYSEIIRIYIKPYRIARIKLEDLITEDIIDWLAALRRKQSQREKRYISDATISSAFKRLKKALQTAKQLRYISQNVADHISLPTKPVRQPVILEPEEVRMLLDYLQAHRLFPLFATEVTTGLRISELTGLRWSDIDLEAGIIYVRGQVHWLQGKPTWIPSAKTKAGQREIHISSELVEILRNWKKVWEEEKTFLGKQWRADEHVFVSSRGQIIRQASIRNTLKRALQAVGLDTSMTFHDMRHLTGSLMLAAGEDIRVVSEILGHSNVSVTETIYAHVLKRSKKSAANRLSYLLKRGIQ